MTGRDVVPGFAKMIAAARKSAGLSKPDLAALAGVSLDTIYKVEAEERAPSLRVAMQLVQALGLKVWLDSPSAVVTDGE